MKADVDTNKAPGAPMYASAEKIYPREMKGRFDSLSKLATIILLGLFYVVPWLTWDDRQAVLFDLPASASTGAEFVRVYRCVTAAAPRPDPAEIAAGGWFAPAALAAWMRREPAVFTTAFRDIFARWTAAGGGMVSG